MDFTYATFNTTEDFFRKFPWSKFSDESIQNSYATMLSLPILFLGLCVAIISHPPQITETTPTYIPLPSGARRVAYRQFQSTYPISTGNPTTQEKHANIILHDCTSMVLSYYDPPGVFPFSHALRGIGPLVLQTRRNSHRCP